MLEDASNQQLLHAWNSGNEAAARILVNRFMSRLAALARSRLSRKLARRLDPEDIVLSAWRSFFVGVHGGRFALPDDDDPWPLLVTLTIRKLARQAERQGADRRDVDREVSESEAFHWRDAVARDPTPDQAAMLVDEVDVLMRRLNTLDREVLSRRLQGDEQSAIAQALGCSERTVRRSLTTIRQLVKEQEAAGNVIKLPSDVVEANAATSGSLPRHKRGSGSEPSRNQYLPSIAYDSFVLRHLVGLGGFGKVYRATRKVDEKTVAVKFLRKRFWKDRQATRAFLTETNALATLKHPNIIECQGSGIAPGGGAFLVMEWIDGCNASAWRRNSALSIADVIRCGIAMAEALATAHAAGIVHGDVAPGNVLLRPDGMFVLTDFGFARSMIDGMPEIGGTPGFLAPEQVCEDFGRIGPRTDIYGLGGILYFLLTGDPPVRGTDVPEILANVLSSWSSRPENSFGADVPAELSQLVGDCLQKEVAARPQSMDDVCRRLVERRS